jgi:alginate O-acetyltransferase complex protein AlgI
LLFQSVGFLFLFLPLLLIALSLAPKGQCRSFSLLFFSYLFYSGSEPLFCIILFFSSVTDYSVSLLLIRVKTLFKKRLLLFISISINLGLLAFFKYGAWLMPEVMPYFQAIGFPALNENYLKGLILPAGISFYTFQSMSYTIDVYRGEIRPEKNFLGFCNYVSYLPQLIAGPIERYKDLSPQISTFNIGLNKSYWSAGIDRITLGLIQKLLIADSCGLIVDRLIEYGSYQNIYTAWVIAIGFGMQIYYDFSAYTHIAIGISLLFGIRLKENFNSPYQAESIQEFWRRWHMTLSRWFRDYLYIPLGGSRHGHYRTTFNIILTFTLVGLWHGAGINFLIWGLLHGLLLVIYHIKKSLFPKWQLNLYIAVTCTFLLVHFTWIPFRVSSLDDTLTIWSAMLGITGDTQVIVSFADISFLCMVTVLTLIIPNASKRWPGSSGWLESVVLLAIAMFAVFSSPDISKFIYFQF